MLVKDDNLRKLVRCSIPIVPIAQPRPRAVTIGKHARMVSNTPKIAQFKTQCWEWVARHWKDPPTSGAVKVRLLFVMPRPKNKCWKTRPMPRYSHTTKPDADNLAKAVLDALSGLVWRDDAQICSLTIHKEVAAGDEAPHVEIQIDEWNEHVA